MNTSQHDGQNLTEAIRAYLDSPEAEAHRQIHIRERFARKPHLSEATRAQLQPLPDRPVVLFEMGTDHR